MKKNILECTADTLQSKLLSLLSKQWEEIKTMLTVSL